MSTSPGEQKECPACGLLSAEEADTCRHCGTAFFFQPECLQPPIDNPADELVIVGQYPGLIEAQVIMSLLEGNGVDACIPEELTPGIFWGTGGSAIERITVRVARRDEEAAQKIIAEGTSV
jgi:hypothetical protein